jgi:3-oxoacyl-[acyl-carrier protein] reductase
MDKLLSGKTALITGASKGIGRKIAEEFASQGANIAFTYLSSTQKGEELENELAGYGILVKGFRSDAGNFLEAENLINEIVSSFGALDIVVNNAGITRDGLLIRMNEAQWDEVIQTNLKSIFNITKAASRPMMKQKKGSFIHISSIVGIKGNAGQANYAASKAGMIGFSKSIALELGSRNIRSNVIAPGFIRTEMTDILPDITTLEWIKNIPMKRMGESSEVAKLALFLASDWSSYISGQVIPVCGGLLT